MDLKAIQELYRYNAWANARTLEAVSTLTPAQFTQHLGGSYPSVQDTLTHALWGEWIWLQRWLGDSPTRVFEPREFPDVEALEARFREVESERASFLKSLSGERLARVVRYTNVQGQTWEYPLWQQMYHVVNHSTYHRGQASAKLRQLGASPHPTDFLVFYDEQAG
jgi:uncharacterized damage-inducible protein DinB